MLSNAKVGCRAAARSLRNLSRRIIICGLIGSGMISFPAELAAQTAYGSGGYYGRSQGDPSGSPLDPLGQRSASESAQSQATAAAAAQAATRVEAINFGDVQEAGGLSQTGQDESATTGARRGSQIRPLEETPVVRLPAPPNEFERFVERSLGRALPRFGADLLVPPTRNFSLPATATIPASYILGPGDVVFIGLSGSINGTLSATVNTNGRIFVPRVGDINLGGIPYGELQATLRNSIGRQYRDFKLTASVIQLRGIRVYVTGFANVPGAYTVSSLSTMINAVFAAGGPAAGGSFRSIQLFRRGQLVSSFDLYDFVRGGDKSKDAVLQNEDVLYIPALGKQAAVSGSVNAEAIYELKPNETLQALLGYAGGMTQLADASRVILFRLSNQDTTGGIEVGRQQLAATLAQGGDLVQVLSSATLARSLDRQSVVVRIEGEVAQPGNYYVAPNTPLADVLAKAGGLTPRAFVYGTTFERLSVKQQQKTSFNEALQQLEISLASAPLTADPTLGDAATKTAQQLAARTTLDRLRQAEPDGRVVLNLTPSAIGLPGNLAIENSDRIYIPPRPTTVGVFGAVPRPASFLIGDGKPKRVKDYLAQAGGPARAADRGEIFVVRANGSVLSKRDGALNAPTLPGDVIFVPVRVQGQTTWARILQLSQLILSAGVSAATIAAISR